MSSSAKIPTLRCVVPTLNSEATLDTTLLSLHSQRQINIEVVVADSGSTDKTLEICQRWQTPVIYVPPGNMYQAINAGLRGCKTDWLAYLNSDDWVYSDSFSRLVSCGESLKADVVYGNCDYTDEQGRFVYSLAAAKPEHLLPLFRNRCMGFAQQAAIFRCRSYQRLQGFDESFLYRGDADFYIRALFAGLQFGYLEGPSVACFRLHEKQFSNRGLALTEVEAERIFNKPEMKPGIRDRLIFARWRMKNLPHYLIRTVRESLLTKRLRFPRSIEPYTHR